MAVIKVMESFSEQLIAARKAQGMTQEKLAEVMEVSRPMISHWENGRAQPDVESLKRLSQVLEYDFLQGESLPQSTPLDQASEDTATSKNKKRPWGYVLAFLGGILLTLFVQFALIPLFTPAPKDIPPQNGFTEEAYSIGWYKQPSEPVAGQAYIDLHANENPVKAIKADRFAGGVGWRYTIYMPETNGVDFTVEELSYTYFQDEEYADVFRYTGEELKNMWGDNILEANSDWDMGGGLPRQELSGVGVLLTGTDANGNQLEFHYYLEFSQEIADE